MSEVSQAKAAIEATIQNLKADAWLTVQAYVMEQDTAKLDHLRALRDQTEILAWAKDQAPSTYSIDSLIG